jgi:enediyne polyketide synthase
MGERLGTLDRLREQGIEALSLDGALDTFERIVAEQPSLHGSLVVAGRFAPMAELLRGHGEVPLNRFLETVRVHYPGIELVADSIVAPGSDPYLLDHRIDGEMVMPGVMALEAMAAAAQALAGDREATTIRNLRFEKAVCVSEQGEQTLRVAALRRDKDAVSCTIRASDDGFAAIRASADFGFAARMGEPEGIPFTRPAQPGVAADDLYAGLFFNRGRFRLVAEFSRLAAFELSAELDAPVADPWFGSFLPQTFVLGEPGGRDAGLHALQATIPQRRVIPVAAEEIELIEPAAPRRQVEARQVAGDRTTFVYDIVFRDDAGTIVERWRRATFRAIAELPVEDLPQAMLVPWLEREVALCFDRTDVKAALVTGPDRTRRRENAVASLGLTAICHRADGRPLILEASGDAQVSISHSGETTLAMTTEGAIGCDLEAVQDSSRLPGVAAPAGLEDWCMAEALRKIGRSPVAMGTWALEVSGAANQRDRVCRHGDLDVMCHRWGAEWIVAVALSSGRVRAGVEPLAPAADVPPHPGQSDVGELLEVGELLDEPG